MHPQIQTHPSHRQTGQQPHLPQRPHRIEPPPTQFFARLQQLGLTGGSRQREDPNMVSEVE
jgi:hypothetical protein